MKRIRALIVDDSAVVRRALRESISADETLDVAGVAANGRIALSLLGQVVPDVVVLDIEMPEMDGLETLKALRQSYPKLPVIMFSTLTQRGATATLDALSLGASDYVTKPSNCGNFGESIERIKNELVPKIKALCGVGVPLRGSGGNARQPLATINGRTPVEVVAIGTSTGGPNALSLVLRDIPAGFPVPILIVQHMPPTFTRFLADRLSAECPVEVHEAGVEQWVAPGHAWLAAGDYHMVVERLGTKIRLRSTRTPPENSCRPSVDVLFRSVAQVYGRGALAVIMTGMGQDGLRGAEQLRAAGAQIMAQDEATSVVWGMPGFVVEAGLADRVLPLSQIAQEIVRKVKESHLVHV